MHNSMSEVQESKADTGAALGSIGWPNPKTIVENVKSGQITKQNAISSLRSVAQGGGPDAKKAQAIIVRINNEVKDVKKPEDKAKVEVPSFGKAPPAFGAKKEVPSGGFKPFGK